MKQKRSIILILATVLALCLTGCGSVERIRNIRVTSWAVESVSPTGLRGLTADLAVGVENPAMQFTLEDIEGVLYYKGTEFVHYTADPVTVRRKSTAVYPLHCKAILGGEYSVLSVLGMARNYDLADFTTDIHARVRLRGGASKSFDFKDIPIKDLIEAE